MMRYRNLIGMLAMIVVLGAARANAAEMFESQIVADFEFKLLSDGSLGGAGFPEDVFIRDNSF